MSLVVTRNWNLQGMSGCIVVPSLLVEQVRYIPCLPRWYSTWLRKGREYKKTAQQAGDPWLGYLPPLSVCVLICNAYGTHLAACNTWLHNPHGSHLRNSSGIGTFACPFKHTAQHGVHIDLSTSTHQCNSTQTQTQIPPSQPTQWLMQE